MFFENLSLLQLLSSLDCFCFFTYYGVFYAVPPAYYAHLAAFRARYYIEDDTDLRSTTSGGDGGAGTRERIAAQIRPLPNIHANVSNVMFYC